MVSLSGLRVYHSKMVRTLFLVLLLSSGVMAQDLSWLTGHWVNDRNEEVWSEVRGGNLMGFNRQFKDGSVVFFEHLRIELSDGRVVYRACPLGKVWTSFELVESEQHRAVFQNLQHDFPQRLDYRRVGDRLQATISGEGQKSVTWEFRLKSLP